jgi:GNAT superfamily N-acetyltransferase
MDRDVDAVISLIDQCEPGPLDAAELREELAGVDRERDAVVVVTAGRVVAWGLLLGGGRLRSAGVHPSAHGRGIGEWLLKWSAWRAEALGAESVGQTVDDERTELVAWLAAHGHTPRYAAWLLTTPAAAAAHSATPAEPHEVDPTLALFRRGQSARGQLLVARRDTHPVGGAFLTGEDTTRIAALATSPDHPDATRELIEAARDAAHRRGHDQVVVSADSTTASLESLESLGLSVERSLTHWAVDIPPRR